MYPLFFYNSNNNLHSSLDKQDDYHHTEILRITKHFLFIKIILRDDYPFIFLKEKKNDDKGVYIEFQEDFMNGDTEIFFF